MTSQSTIAARVARAPNPWYFLGISCAREARVTVLQYRTDSDEDAPTSYRYDRGQLGPPRKTKEGYLILEGYAAKPGILEYRTPNGIRRELVLPDELARPSSMDSLKHKPATFKHPKPADRPVGPHNVKRLGVGDVPKVWVDEHGFLQVKVIVRDAEAIQAIESLKSVELSPGYIVMVEMTSGEHDEFGPYDAIQRGRLYDHLAIVDRARGGSEVRLRVDSDDNQVDSPPDGAPALEEPKMNPTLLAVAMLLSVRVDAADTDETLGPKVTAAAQDIKDKAERVDAAEVEVTSATERADAADAAKTKAEADLATEQEAHRADSMDLPALQDWHAKRSVLEARAKVAKVEKVDEMDNEALTKAVVVAVVTDAKTDAEPAYYSAAFDMLPEIKVDGAGSWSGLRKERRKDSDDKPAKPIQTSTAKTWNKSFEANRPTK